MRRRSREGKPPGKTLSSPPFKNGRCKHVWIRVETFHLGLRGRRRTKHQTERPGQSWLRFASCAVNATHSSTTARPTHHSSFFYLSFYSSIFPSTSLFVCLCLFNHPSIFLSLYFFPTIYLSSYSSIFPSTSLFHSSFLFNHPSIHLFPSSFPSLAHGDLTQVDDMKT